MEIKVNILSASPYRSPVRLVRHVQGASKHFSPQAIQQTIIILLAEIGERDELLVEGISYSKNDIVLLENVNEDNWYHHSIIYLEKALLHFLEEFAFDMEGLDKAYQFRYKPSFVHFVSPFFSLAFFKVSHELLGNKDEFARIKKLIDYSGFILPEHEDQAFTEVHKYLNGLLETVRTITWEKLSRDEMLLHFIFNAGWIEFVNKLPSRFAQMPEEIALQILLALERLQNKATAHYLHQVCLHLKTIHCSEELREKINRFETMVYKSSLAEGRKKSWQSSENRALWAVGSICLIGLLTIIFQLARVKEKQTFFPEAYNSTAATSTVDEDLVSSVNEKNFKIFLSYLGYGRKGRQVKIKTGEPPFENISSSPSDKGGSKLTIKNQTGSDAIVFYFSSANLLLNSSANVFAAYIKNGDEYSFLFRHNFGRVNLAFGREWMRLKNPLKFPLQKWVDNFDKVEGPERENWQLNEYFRWTPSLQYYLNHDILIQDFPETSTQTPGVPSAIMLHQPESYELRSPYQKEVELVMSEKENRISIEASGSLYVYESSETFAAPDPEARLIYN